MFKKYSLPIVCFLVCIGIGHTAKAFDNTEKGKRSETDNAEIAYNALKAEEFEIAFPEFLRLAKSGDPYAQQVVGVMYSKGEGVAKSYSEALRWYHAAAIQNRGVAQSALGAMFIDGKGVEVNARTAYKWYYLASLNEVPFSKEILQWIGDQLDTLELAQAKRLAEDCIYSSFSRCPISP